MQGSKEVVKFTRKKYETYRNEERQQDIRVVKSKKTRKRQARESEQYQNFDYEF